jgi:hypothetical protein
MKTMGSLPALMFALAACSAAGTTPGAPPTWQTGRYELEASISYSYGGSSRTEERRAELLVEPGGALSLISSVGLCREPPPGERGEDEARGQRSFQCGEDRYTLRPAAQSVAGEMVVPVEESEVVRECARYETAPDGSRVCAEYRERMVTRTVMKRARMTVVRRDR